MGKLEFNGCKLKVQLEAQSPITIFSMIRQEQLSELQKSSRNWTDFF